MKKLSTNWKVFKTKRKRKQKYGIYDDKHIWNVIKNCYLSPFQMDRCHLDQSILVLPHSFIDIVFPLSNFLHKYGVYPSWFHIHFFYFSWILQNKHKNLRTIPIQLHIFLLHQNLISTPLDIFFYFDSTLHGILNKYCQKLQQSNWYIFLCLSFGKKYIIFWIIFDKN